MFSIRFVSFGCRISSSRHFDFDFSKCIEKRNKTLEQTKIKNEDFTPWRIQPIA